MRILGKTFHKQNMEEMYFIARICDITRNYFLPENGMNNARSIDDKLKQM